MKAIKIKTKLFFSNQTYIMGILNITPDSFSDGGKYLDLQKALKQCEKLITEGADIIDIGAESSRPGAISITAQEEIQRLKNIISEYQKNFSTPISLDTTKPEVIKWALDQNIDLINLITGSQIDFKTAKLIASYHKPIILMHMQGSPQTMQNNPSYNNLLKDIYSELQKSIQTAQKAGITDIIIDPGIGFGKNLNHNLIIIKNLHYFKKLKYPILIGTSRKSFLGLITKAKISDRLPESLSSAIISAQNGATFLRVHDVRETKKALQILNAIKNAKK